MVELKNPAARHNVPAARIATLAPSNPVAWLSRGGLGAGNSKCLVFANSLPTVGTAQGVSVRPTAATVPPSHLTRVGNVVDGTNRAQISTAQPNRIAVSIAIEVAVTDFEMPSFVASLRRDAIASSPVGK